MERLWTQITHFGYVDDKEALMSNFAGISGDIVVSTCLPYEFFFVSSIMEAILLGCHPLRSKDFVHASRTFINLPESLINPLLQPLCCMKMRISYSNT